ncbi:PLP-dependent transferase [Ceraceosorus guamensis]|uniref:PLP-dependent transferase n=1 Tax=Ceraceosorus guamensis TaxID=1522189 RepID=A0A316VS34_9BASI|nr:PLP-dependent transferase [Ceraceosorus guamensis]PWN40024.1 PLP-dependent transferase [Ceraceosorus guamensis]
MGSLLSTDRSSASSSGPRANLSTRGARNAAEFADFARKMSLARNVYDERDNPTGIVILGVADNGLLRGQLLKFFNAQGNLDLNARELTYADRIFASQRLLVALCKLFNEVPDGVPPLTGQHHHTRLITALEPEHIIIGSGATGILDNASWALCDAGDGILLSVPAYNAFWNDFNTRSQVQIVEVPVSPADVPLDIAQHVQAYEKAYLDATKKGIDVRVLLLCNPHNPTGAIYPRELVIELAKFAAKHDLHLLSDEIYARSCFRTENVPNPPDFHSVLTMDLAREANLNPAKVHVVTSASKDFSINASAANGFRLGVFISQHNKEVRDAVSALAVVAQSSAPAGALWYHLLEDGDKFLHWFLTENRRRLSIAYAYVFDWAKHHSLPVAPSNAGHFLLIDFASRLASRSAKEEERMTAKLIKNGVFVAPGAQYHHPIPGWFRLTFSMEPHALKVGLSRIEQTLGLQTWIDAQPDLEFGEQETEKL